MWFSLLDIVVFGRFDKLAARVIRFASRLRFERFYREAGIFHPKGFKNPFGVPDDGRWAATHSQKFFNPTLVRVSLPHNEKRLGLHPLSQSQRGMRERSP